MGAIITPHLVPCANSLKRSKNHHKECCLFILMAYARKRAYSGYSKLPAPRNSRNTYKRAKGSTHRTQAPRRVVIPRQVTGLASETRVTLAYTHFKNPISVGADTWLTYTINGVYDPYTGALGGQPTGFDQWMALYGRYRVAGAKITATVINAEAYPIRMTLVPAPKDDSALRLRYNNGTLSMGKDKIVKGYGPSGASSSGTLTNKISMSTLVGDKWKFDDDYFGTSVSNPSSSGLAVWYIQIQEPLLGVSNLSAYVDVRIDYDVIFSQRRILTDA